MKDSRVRLTCNILYPMDEEAPEIEWFKGAYPVREDDRVRVSSTSVVCPTEIAQRFKKDANGGEGLISHCSLKCN